MTSIANKLTEIVGSVFEEQNLPAELGLVRVSDRPDLAQFQCNGAMAAAKQARKNPREVAGMIVAALEGHEAIESLEIAGPGFININVKDSFISSFLSNNSQSETFGSEGVGAGKTIIIDYGGPNVAKAMHVGHLRSSIIGDAVRRMCLFAGYNALGDVHMGDWGTPMGQIISELEIMHPEWSYFDVDFTGDYPEESPVTMDDLAEIYPKASAACKEDAARGDLARKATQELQNGHVGYRALWQHFIDVSIAGMKENFDSLGVHFDFWKGEACVHDFIVPMVEDLKAKGFAQDSDGALVVPVVREDDSKEIPPLILYKRDGAVMYGTTDMATLVDRMSGRDHSAPEKIIYVVDQRQSLHFEQVFRASQMAGIAPEDKVELIHAGFGTMNGTDGKPFKTRAGGVMKLEDLISMGIEKARARLAEAHLAEDMDEEEGEGVAKKVALAAIKFADLQNQRQSDYVFDLDRLTAFEGKTGPYMLYQVVRIKSLLRKSGIQSLDDVNADGFVIQEADRSLALLLCEFPDHFDNALKNYTPHVLCDYAYRLAQAFSSFYGNCHILSEENADVRASRLALCALTARQLECILGLLGIEVPDRM